LGGRGVGLGRGGEGGRGLAVRAGVSEEGKERGGQSGWIESENGAVSVGTRGGEHGRCNFMAERFFRWSRRLLMLDAWSRGRLWRIAGGAAFRMGSQLCLDIGTVDASMQHCSEIWM
jgi:hypothetical protein